MSSDPADKALAIVGLSAILPDAPDYKTFWSNLEKGRYSIGDIPPDRWNTDLYYDPDPSLPGKSYSKIGGFVRKWEWEPMKWKLPIPPKVADAMDEAQKWAVACARNVLLDYGHPERTLDFERTAVVVGTAMAGDLHYWTSLGIFLPEYAQALGEAPAFAALSEADRKTILSQLGERVADRFPGVTEDSMPGELANCIAGRIANLFDFHGPNFVCDAACASGLAAIDAAREGLITGEYDAALVGGVDRNMGPAPYVKFCKIGALSATGTRPYADGADGFVMGEGAIFFLLKRLADAEAAGDPIYAVVRGVGGSSDGRGKGITAPNPAGQKFAIERAWADAGLSPATAGMVEGHGTSTRVGDVVEVQALTDVFAGAGAPVGSIALGSVKSNIGHLKGAAGAAGLLKAIGALHTKQLFPSLGFKAPNPNIDFDQSPFRVNTQTKPWDPPEDGVRRAGISAFGFGGTNFHAVLEEYIPGRLTRSRGDVTVAVGETIAKTLDDASVELKAPQRGATVLGAADPASLRSKIEALLTMARSGRTPESRAPSGDELRAGHRAAFDFADAADLANKAERALKALDAAPAVRPAMEKALRAQGVFFGEGEPGKVAFLFTGQGSQYANMLRSLRETEPVVAATFEEADRVLTPLIGQPLSEILFVDPDNAGAVKQAEDMLRRTEITQPAVLTVDTALCRLMAEYGLVPDLVMGHSLGEYGALVASGALSFEQALEAVSARGREMASLSVEDNGLMAAVFAPLTEIEETLAGIDGNVVVANINSSSQAVIGGASEAVEAAMETLKGAGHNVVQLPVSHAFHTSIVSPASEPLRAMLERLELKAPQIPLVGNVDGELYPMGADAPAKMLDLLAAQVASPVQFVKGLGTLYDNGARVFVEIGPKRALHGFAEDVLGERDDALALFTNHPKGGDAGSFNQALCGLWASGIGIRDVATERPVAAAEPERAVEPTPRRPVPAETAPVVPRAGASGELADLLGEFVERGAAILGRKTPASDAHGSITPVVTGAALGLPGRDRVFADDNVQHILDGEQEIDLIPTRFRHAMLDKHITRLVKSGGEPHFETIESSSDVIKLAARAGAFDLVDEFGVSEERVAAFDVVTRLAVAVGIEALRDAGLPLVMHYRKTTRGTRLPVRWMLPESLRDDTAVIFASAFPGYDSFAQELQAYHEDHARHAELQTLRELLGRAQEDGNASSVMVEELERRIHELDAEREENAYTFDRRFLFRTLAMGHSQFAEYIGARGPNTAVNSACASTTQAFAVAEDWINAGRARRVVVVAADDCTSDNMLEWVGAGFLASGAAATDDTVEDAAVPFDRRRHGMILGMGAAAVVIEAPDCARERGLRPICDIASTVTANSAFHGTRLDVEHIAGVMEKVVAQAEERFGIDRQALARELVFVSHETYTPARGGSASAEVESLRKVFGAAAEEIVVANTKGMTGHPMGVGIEDVVAVKALETGVVPPVPNYKEPDPDLGTLRLSRGGRYPIRYALRLGAGFGSQISMSLLRWCPTHDGTRPAADELGYQSRLEDKAAFYGWLAQVSDQVQAEVETVNRTLRVIDAGLPTVVVRGQDETTRRAAQAVAEAPAAAVQREAAPVADAPAAEPAAGSVEDAVRQRVLEIVAEKTGYPVEMLEPDLDLEADLGIDTVKQAETFAAIREAYGIERDENLQLRDYPTLEHAVGFVMERADASALPAASEASPAAAPTEPAAAASAAPPAGGSVEEQIRQSVLEIVAEKTGYPVEMLEPDLDLEADLGIDTVKQAETFAAIREAYGIERDENLQLRDYPTLEHAVGFVMERADASALPAAAEAPAAAPAEPAAAPSAGGSVEDQIRARVLEIVSEKTGYPVEMLEPDLDLEADLGIDTVKQAETFAAIREAYGIERDENLQLRDYPTLEHAVRFVMERRPDRDEIAAEAAAPSETEGEVSEPPPGTASVADSSPVTTTPVLPEGLFQGSDEAARQTRRRVPVAVLRPALSDCKPTGVELAAGTRVWVMPDRGGVAKALVRRLEARGVEVLSADPESPEIGEAVKQALEAGPIHGVYWLPALDAGGELADLDLASWRAALDLRAKRLFHTARVLYDCLDQPGSFLVSATRLGGAHGLDAGGATCPMGGAVTGLTKALSRERPNALVKAVDFPKSRRTAELADVLIDETLSDPGAVEVGVVEGRRCSVALEDRPVGDGEGLVLDASSVFVVTGAAGSIVSAITADLANGVGGGVFHLLDLAAAPEAGAPDVERFSSDPEGLRREIFERIKASGERATPVLVEREMASIERAHAAATALAAVRAAGGEAHWHAVDLRDGEAVSKVVEQITSNHDRVDVLLHAAGLERSRSAVEKPPEEFDLVFDVKADGWFNLLRALGETPLGATVGFSSIAGRFGNAGQTDYSAANDLLCKWATRLSADREDTRALAIDWTAWAQIGMASRGSIPEIMQRAGIDMLDPEAGIPIVRQELMLSGRSGEVLIAGALGVMEAERDPDGGLEITGSLVGEGPLAGCPTHFDHATGLATHVEIDPKAQAFLDHHRIDGTPVLPGVMGLEGFAELVAGFTGADAIPAIEDVRFLAPFKFYRDEPRWLEIAARFELAGGGRDGEGVSADCVLTGSRELKGLDEPQVTEHFRARLVPSSSPAPSQQMSPPREAPSEVVGAEDIYRLYFHGPAFQVLDRVWGEGDRTIGRLAEGLPSLYEPGDASLRTRPLLLELCFQTAGIAEMARTGRMGLPSEIARVELHDCDDPEAPVHAVVESRGDGVQARVVDARGQLLLSMDGYVTSALPAELPADARKALAPAIAPTEA